MTMSALVPRATRLPSSVVSPTGLSTMPPESVSSRPVSVSVTAWLPSAVVPAWRSMASWPRIHPWMVMAPPGASARPRLTTEPRAAASMA